MLEKQDFAFRIAAQMQDRAVKINAERNGPNQIGFVATFEDRVDLSQNQAIADACLAKLTELGVFGSCPKTRIAGPRLSVNFNFDEITASRVAGLPGFVLARQTRDKRTGKMTGPWPVDHNPLIYTEKRNRNTNNRNKRKSNFITDDVVEADYDDDVRQMMLQQIMGAMATPVEETQDTSKGVMIQPYNKNEYAGKFINSIAKTLSHLGGKHGGYSDEIRRTRTAYSMWAHFMSAMGLVAQTEIFGALDRLQNDRPSHPCSMVWIHKVLAGVVQDPDVPEVIEIFESVRKRSNKHGKTIFVTKVPVNGIMSEVVTHHKVEKAFMATPLDKDGKPQFASNPAQPLFTHNGYYYGLGWPV